MKKIISIVVAVSRNGVIGADNKLAWHLPDDLRFFKKLTLGKPIVMGRKTWESLGRPLPKRHNIVLTRSLGYVATGATVANDVEDVLRVVGDVPELMVIGGGEIFSLFLPMVNRMYVTSINAEIEGDVFMPAVNRDEWERFYSSHHVADALHRYSFTIEGFDKSNY